MHILFSPSKQMNFESAALPENAELMSTTPRFSDKARMLNERLKEFSRQELGRLMKMSGALAEQTYETVRAFDDHSGKPALFTYSGTSFQALDTSILDKESLSFASDRLSILSGMYGLLCPMDLIAPYRLEMKTALSLKGAKNLTAFWKPLITEELSEKIRKCGDKTVINLASGEYSKTIDKNSLNCQVINFHFKDKSSSGYRTVGVYAKTARGKMLQRILSEKILNPDVLKDTPTYDYEFRSDMSDNDNWVFTRG
jgi:uncharacterized protein